MSEKIFWIAIALAGFLTLLFGWKVFLAFQQHRWLRSQKRVLLSIRVSRTNEKLPIVAEQIFAILHGSLSSPSFFERIRGETTEAFSFEIASVGGMIRFYTSVPENLRSIVENQIYAQYPDVEIAEVDDYATNETVEVVALQNSTEESDSTEVADPTTALATSADFKKVETTGRAYVAEIGLGEPDIYPIKRYTQFEDKLARTAVDPLSGLTSTLSKLAHADDIAAVQIVARPLPESWSVRAKKCAGVLANKKFFGSIKLKTWYTQAFMTRRTWPKIIFFPVYWLFAFQGWRAGLGGEDIRPAEEARTGEQHEGESGGDAVANKIVKLAYESSVRVAYFSDAADVRTAKMKVKEMAGAFKQFNLPHLNYFKISEIGGGELAERFRFREINDSFILNVEELATVWHLPNIEVKTPNIFWVSSKKLEPPLDLPRPEREENITALGKTNYRGSDRLFGIRQEDRRRHVYIIGKTGMGKSTLLENMILSDIQEGKGVAVVDPHGDLADHILDNIPSHRTNDVVVFDPSDRDFPVAFNMLENIDPSMNSVVASGLVGIFKKLYADSWGPRLEHILRNTIMSLVEYPNTTMLGIPRILSDKKFRAQVVKKISDPVVKRFWTDEFEPMQERQRIEAISPIQNKVGQFLSSPIIRNIVGQPKSMIDLRFAMDHRRIFVCNLSKGKIGEDNSSLLGSMIITKFQLDAMSRSNIPEKDRVDFYLYVDEFQNFATDSFATILSEARKYRLNLTMANQYIAQMSDEVRDAVFGNVGTLMTFQVGYDDAEVISKQYSEVATPEDLTQLPKYNLYTKLLVDGMPTQPFSAATLPPIGEGIEEGRREKVIKFSRERFAKPRAVVEDKINRWSSSGDEEKKLPPQNLDKKFPSKKTDDKKIDAPKKDEAKKSEPTKNSLPSQNSKQKTEKKEPTQNSKLPKNNSPKNLNSKKSQNFPSPKSGYQLPKIRPQKNEKPVDTTRKFPPKPEQKS